MSKGIILYESKYGATRKYVEWLVEEINFHSLQTRKADIQQVKGYDTIIFCGGIYASGISDLSFLHKHYQNLQGKKIAIFCVGASPFDEKAFQQIKTHNLKQDLADIPIFYGRGSWDLKNMGFKDRTLCKMLQKAISKKDPAEYEPWMEALMSAGGQKCDWTDRKFLKPLLRSIQTES